MCLTGKVKEEFKVGIWNKKFIKAYSTRNKINMQDATLNWKEYAIYGLKIIKTENEEMNWKISNERNKHISRK